MFANSPAPANYDIFGKQLYCGRQHVISSSPFETNWAYARTARPGVSPRVYFRASSQKLADTSANRHTMNTMSSRQMSEQQLVALRMPLARIAAACHCIVRTVDMQGAPYQTEIAD